MELTIRDWMVIVGVLLILAVALDAWRRVRSEKYSRVKVKLVDAEGDPTDDEALFWPKELPNGPARVVQRRDLVRAAAEARRTEPAPEASPPEAATAHAADDADADDVELVTGFSSTDDEREPETLDWLDSVTAEGSGAPESAPEKAVASAAGSNASGSSAPKPPSEKEAPGRLARTIDPEVFMLNVHARNPAGFRGDDILHILLACDLRFGDMSFFHRHELEAGRGPIQFSVANMMQPGVFDIDNMSELNTPGLVFFLTVPGPEDMMKAFDYMLETAQAVARNLDGDVLDESHCALTSQTLEHCRQKIRDVERRMLAQAR